MTKPLLINDVVLRDSHQSLFATRMRTEDMLPIAAKLDDIGYWALETWGGATFDACIRFLGEDPWERLRLLKAQTPKTQHMMLLRAQNLLGYRHYADDVVRKFVERAGENGMDVFRIFDAMNDPRNFKTAVQATIDIGKHAQGAISYTTSPVHSVDNWVDLGKRLEDLGCHSLCIKDMSGLLGPYAAEDLIVKLKASCDVPIALHCHATTGLSTATLFKAVEAGIDIVDTSISSMSGTYGHTATESIVAMFQGTERDTGLELIKFEEIAAYFREIRKKYAKFEGELKGVDSRILNAQVPGGMLTNMENQLREQGMPDKLDEVLREVPKVRKDLGYVSLVTPTSQIVGTQAVLNVMNGQRYKTVTKETKGVLLGEYGATPAPVDAKLQATVKKDGDKIIDCRPADLLANEMQRLTGELQGLALAKKFKLADRLDEDVLIHAMFPQVGLNFLENRDNPDAFKPVPTGREIDLPATTQTASDANIGAALYRVVVNGNAYEVEVALGGEVRHISPTSTPAAAIPEPAAAAPAAGGGEPLPSPLAGSIFKLLVVEGQKVQADDVLLIMEAMKMETEVRSIRAGTITRVAVREGDKVKPGDPLVFLS